MSIALSLAAPLPAADPAALVQTCYGCHGPGGVSQYSDIPIIAGQAYTLVSDNLMAFRAGERPCTETAFRYGDTARPATSMCEVAGALSDEDIEALAEHFESLEYPLAKQDFDASLAAAGQAVHERSGCVACHDQTGNSNNGLGCRLAGQWTPYLRKAFAQIRAGERFAPVVMRDAIQALSEQDIEALLAFYASQVQ